MRLALCHLLTLENRHCFNPNRFRRYDGKQIRHKDNNSRVRNLCAIAEAEFVFGPDASGHFKIII
jgi:hypothetical protein